MQTRKLTVILCAVIALLATQVNAKDKDAAPDNIPKAVLDAFALAKPKVKVREYEVKVKDGQTYYELEYKENGLEHEYIYTADGTLFNTEEGIRAADLPANIIAAIRASYPSATIKEVKKVQHVDGNLIGYEVELKQKGKEIDLDMDANGQITKAEVDD